MMQKSFADITSYHKTNGNTKAGFTNMFKFSLVILLASISNLLVAGLDSNESTEKDTPSFVSDVRLFNTIKGFIDADASFSNDTRIKEINDIFNENIEYIKIAVKDNKDKRKEETINRILENVDKMAAWVLLRANQNLYLSLREYTALCDFLSVAFALDTPGRLYYPSWINHKSEEREIVDSDWDRFSWESFKVAWEDAQNDAKEWRTKNPRYYVGHMPFGYLRLEVILIPFISDTGLVATNIMVEAMGFFDKRGKPHTAVFLACATNKHVNFDTTKDDLSFNLFYHDIYHVFLCAWAYVQPQEILEAAKIKYDLSKKILQLAQFNEYLKKNAEKLGKKLKWIYADMFENFHEDFRISENATLLVTNFMNDQYIGEFRAGSFPERLGSAISKRQAPTKRLDTC